MRKVDVIVCGAGIAGSISAALLASQGYRVLIADRGEGGVNHLPECWFPRITSAFQELDLEEGVVSTLHPSAAAAFCSADGNCIVEVSSKGLEYVDRNRLDRILLQKALEKGVEPILKTQIVSCEVSDSGVSLSFKTGDQIEGIQASYLIDATGKSAFLTHLLSLPVRESKLDPRVAYFSHFESIGNMPASMRIVAIAGGYLFCIPVGKDRISVGCVLMETQIDKGESMEQIFTSKLALSTYVMEMLSKAKRVLPVIEAKNAKRICLAPAGPSYRLAGDAAAFLDPFFCPGIDFAIFSAEQAVLSIERNDPEGYQKALMAWLQRSEGSIYQQMHQSVWQDVMRLFADPHLPWAISSSLVHSFSGVVGGDLKQKMTEARQGYEMASY